MLIPATFLDVAAPGQSEAFIHAREGLFGDNGPIGSGPGISGEKVIRLGHRPGVLDSVHQDKFLKENLFAGRTICC